MPKIAYIDKEFNESSRITLARANIIILEYLGKGLNLTLRQLYYKLVAKGWIKNEDKEYSRLSRLISDARLTGLIDWNAIVDRTRKLEKITSWEDAREIVNACVRSFKLDRWKYQSVRPEVWIEKDAVIGVVHGICKELDTPYFSCRGFTSQTAIWEAAQRLRRYIDNGQEPIIIHFGDHDPSGIFMTKDIEDRLSRFLGEDFGVYRLALNWEQIKEYNPPPNPTKFKDPRASEYIANYGPESWELDALDPEVIINIIRENILELRDEGAWEEALDEENKHVNKLEEIVDNWEE